MTTILIALQLLLLVSSIITRLVDDDDSVYNPKFSFCKELDRKMAHFPKKGSIDLKCYMNITLPVATVAAVYIAWNYYQAYPLTSVRFWVAAAFGATALANCFLFREIDRLAYYLNYLFLVLLSVIVLLPVMDDPALIGKIPVLLAGFAINCAFFFQRRELFLLSAKELAEKYTLI